MKTSRWILLILILSLSCVFSFSNSEVVALPISGSIELFYHQFQGDMPSIELDLNGELINTGPINYFLDLTNPKSQVHKFDFDNMAEEFSVDLLITFPLLDSLNEAPQRFHLAGTRSITDIDPPDLIPGEAQILNIFGDDYVDIGIFEPNQLFEGWTYTNHFIPISPIPLPVEPPDDDDDDGKIACYGDVILQGSGEIIGELTSPDGTQVITLNFTGTGRKVLKCEPVPEPSTFMLFLSLLVPFILFSFLCLGKL